MLSSLHSLSIFGAEVFLARGDFEETEMFLAKANGDSLNFYDKFLFSLTHLTTLSLFSGVILVTSKIFLTTFFEFFFYGF